MDSVVEDNEVGLKHTANSGPKKGTRATLTVAVPAGKTSVVLDFSEALVLPPAVGIAEARCVLSGPFATGLTTEILGTFFRRDISGKQVAGEKVFVAKLAGVVARQVATSSASRCRRRRLRTQPTRRIRSW